jgi:hypothetical protein
MQAWNRRLISIIPLSLVAFVLGVAQGPGLKPFDITSDADFRDYEQVVTKYAHKHRSKAENTFCVLGFRTGDYSKSAWIIWKEGKQIILWEGSPDLDSSRRKINLKSDVVAAEKDLHGSTYLVTQAWVSDIISTCDRSGVKFESPKRRNQRNRSPGDTLMLTLPDSRQMKVWKLEFSSRNVKALLLRIYACGCQDVHAVHGSGAVESG